jgi:hypothetical protein
MKKLLLISIFFLVVNLSFAQTTVPIDVNVLSQIVDILQKSIQRGQIQAQVIETQPITPESLRPILPDEDRSDDAIVQINNLKITRILLNPGIENVRAIFFAVRGIDWKCFLFESGESEKSLPCILNIRRPILQKELAIQISNDTILLQKNRQRAKLEDFKVGDKINVYGFMDKDNFGIDALIVRNLNLPRIAICKPRPPCLDQTPPCLIPEPVEGWCPKPGLSVKVLSPNGGEVWQKGTTQLIKWQDNRQFLVPTTTYYDLHLIPKMLECTGRICPSPLMPEVIYVIASRVPAQPGQETAYEWEVAKTKDNRPVPDGEYKVEVCESGTNNCDMSDNYFKIVSRPVLTGSIKVLSPNGGETLIAGQYYTIRWAGPKKLQLPGYKNLAWAIGWFRPNGNAGSIATVPVNQFSYNWKVELSSWITLPVSDVKVRIVLVKNCLSLPCPEPSSIIPETFDESDDYFTIIPATVTPSSIKVISPNGGEVWQQGTTQTIRWTGGMQQMRLLYAKNDGSVDYTRESITIVSHYGTPDYTGIYNWQIPSSIPPGEYYLQVEGCCGETGGFDNSDAPFSIVAPSTTNQ